MQLTRAFTTIFAIAGTAAAVAVPAPVGNSLEARQGCTILGGLLGCVSEAGALAGCLLDLPVSVEKLTTCLGPVLPDVCDCLTCGLGAIVTLPNIIDVDALCDTPPTLPPVSA
ncbi:hypothetical protein QBC35DRAFT_534530 [Podospora australis]|uniref:Uncharacterized protein n=1 Tax=Podospora australis TaxID=1536484 RepID=A0AAN6WN36_9PEZI|nr:hypothetical protein QBC35DRAFT_534530 [Podospora australis]